MVVGFLSRFGGGGRSAIENDLRRITYADSIDVPKDMMMSIAQASHNMDDRRDIMKHLRECLAEPKHWRRVYNGLLLLEDLLQRGSAALMTESAEGLHFDIVQRLSFLEHFELATDRRVQSMVRQKASALRAEVKARLENGGASPGTEPRKRVQTHSVESSSAQAREADAGRDLPAPASASTAKSISHEDPMPAAPKGRTMVNGVVAVGHSEDTDSEPDVSRDSARQAQRKSHSPRTTRNNGSSFKDLEKRRGRVLDDSTDSDSPEEGRERRGSTTATAGRAPKSAAARPEPERPPERPTVPQPEPSVDLLDL